MEFTRMVKLTEIIESIVTNGIGFGRSFAPEDNCVDGENSQFYLDANLSLLDLNLLTRQHRLLPFLTLGVFHSGQIGERLREIVGGSTTDSIKQLVDSLYRRHMSALGALYSVNGNTLEVDTMDLNTDAISWGVFFDGEIREDDEGWDALQAQRCRQIAREKPGIFF